MRAHHAWPAPATPSGACRPQRSLALRSQAIFGGSLMRQSSEVRVYAPIIEFSKSGSSAGTFTVVLIHRRGQIRRRGRCFWSRGYSFDKRMWLRLRQVRYGSNSKSARFTGMSVLPSTADVVGPPRHVRKVPRRDSCGCSKTAALFDHQVGAA